MQGILESSNCKRFSKRVQREKEAVIRTYQKEQLSPAEQQNKESPIKRQSEKSRFKGRLRPILKTLYCLPK